MLKYGLCFLSLFIFINVHAQDYCIENRFSTSDYFSYSQIEIKYNVSYGLADNWYMGQPIPEENTFEIAYPKKTIDNLAVKPLIVLVHGGAFGGGDKALFDDFIIQYAKSGYVAAAINYRLGWDSGLEPGSCTGNGQSLAEATYRAVQDIKAAMRYLAAYADDYGIDVNQMFIGGSSSGAAAVLSSVYMNQTDFNTIFPGLESQLGKIDESTNTIKISYNVKGIINMWGGIFDTSFIDPYENMPVLSFYGTNDSIVPPDVGPVYNCPQYEALYGSRAITNRLRNLSICYNLHTSMGGSHKAYGSDYTMPNIACFIKQILCNTCATNEYEYYLPECDTYITGIADEPGNSLFAIYPNPSSQYIIVRAEFSLQDNSQFKVFDGTGRLMPVIFKTDGNIAQADVSNLSNGIYFIQIITGNIPNTLSFTIQH